MPTDTVQMQMIRRYARLLREAQKRNPPGPRIGAKERRRAKEAAAAAVSAVQPPERSTV
jgi:hypothetical protein